MVKVITLNSDHGICKTNVEIDNSTEFKNFEAINLTDEKKNNKVSVLLDIENKTIDINSMTLRGTEVDLFLEFINQIK